MLSRYWMLVCWILWGVGLQGQSIPFVHYSSQNGLPNDVIYHIYQDKLGYIWVCTDDGLSRFDGNDFENFSQADGLTSPYPIHMTQGEDSTLYLSMWKGVPCGIKGDSIFVLDLPEDYASKTYSIRVEKDTFITWQYSSMFRFSLKDSSYRKAYFTEIPETGNKEIRLRIPQPQLDFERQGGTQFEIIEGALYGYRSGPGVYRAQSLGDTILQPIWEDMVGQTIINDIYQDPSGKIWLAAFGEIYCRTSDGKYRKWTNLPQVPIYYVRSVNPEWVVFATFNKDNYGDEVYLFQVTTGRVINLGSTLGIQSPPNWLTVDQEGNIWIATFGDGMYRVDHTFFQTLTYYQENKVQSLLEISPQEMLVGTSNGILQVSKKAGIRRRLSPGTSIIDLFAHQDNVYFTRPRESKLYDLKGQHKQWRIASAQVEHKHGLFVTYDPRILLIANNFELTDPLYVSRKMEEELTIRHVLIRSSREVWAGGEKGILVIGPDETGKWGILRRLDSKDGICGNEVNHLLEAQDKSIWIASDLGLSRYFADSISCLSYQDGVMFPTCKKLLQDRNGLLWIGSNDGLMVYNGNYFLGMNQQSGLLGQEVTYLLENSNQELWIGSNKGLTIRDNQGPPVPKPAPPFHIDAGDYQPGATYPPNQNFRLEFKGLSYAGHQSVQYQYKLDNAPWITTNKSVLELKNLAAGDHILTARARTFDSRWSPERSFQFSILGWWYQPKWWLLLIAGMTLISLILWYRITRFKRLSKKLSQEIEQRKKADELLSLLRSQVAQDFHDEVGNKLASITVLSNLAKLQMEQKPEEISPLLEKIEARSKALHRDTRDFIWSIDSQSDLLPELFTYLRDFGEDFFEQIGLTFYVEFSGLDPDSELKLPPTWSRHILLLFKEAMTNVAKHSDASQVVLNFSVNDRSLRISLENDGRDFALPETETGKGLKSMRERAMHLHGELFLSSRRTELNFEIPPGF